MASPVSCHDSTKITHISLDFSQRQIASLIPETLNCSQETTDFIITLKDRPVQQIYSLKPSKHPIVLAYHLLKNYMTQFRPQFCTVRFYWTSCASEINFGINPKYQSLDLLTCSPVLCYCPQLPTLQLKYPLIAGINLLQICIKTMAILIQRISTVSMMRYYCTIILHAYLLGILIHQCKHQFSKFQVAFKG